jgi:uncharacterized cupredoxin-like copper-binding protein
MQAYSGVCGHDFVDFSFWPKELQGGFLKARYKPTNRIEIHKWIEKEDHFAEEYVSDLIFSTNLSFIPVDLRFGPRGAAYVCDWYNPVKGHAQYSLRDPRRDRKSGRIWRIVPKGATLQDPPSIAGAPIPELLDHLKSPHYRVRYWAKRELRSRQHTEVATALGPWLNTLDKDDPNHTHQLLESLWLLQGLYPPAARNVGEPFLAIVESLFRSDNHLAAAASLGALRYWGDQFKPEEVHSLLRRGATHSSQHVRREAALAASYVGTNGAMEAILPILDQPAGVHLAYALSTALHSEALARHWKSTPQAAEIGNRLKSFASRGKSSTPSRNHREVAFDAQKNLQTIKLGCIPERLLFTKNRLNEKAGKPVKLVFNNPDATQHNFVLLDQGTPIEEIGLAANEMAKSPEGAKKGFLPEDKRILQASRLLDPNTSQTLRFIAPATPGIYPYLCTFPGHWILMKGELIVE